MVQPGVWISGHRRIAITPFASGIPQEISPNAKISMKVSVVSFKRTSVNLDRIATGMAKNA